MRVRVFERLYVGTVEDCVAVAGDENWFVVHACKYPCHAAKCGAKVAKDAPNYLSQREGDHLFLNMIDPPVPMFPRGIFDAFLAFMDEAWRSKKNILIHCNKGESRAPSLALLFLAKRAFRISNLSYDDAWDDFEKLTLEQYKPSAGIEGWLRENWFEFDAGAGSRAGSDQHPQGETMSGVYLPKDHETENAIGMIKESSLLHFAQFSKIETKEHVWETPIPNTMQFAIEEAYQWCMENGVPCRLMNLKPRQVGSSTKFAHLCYHHMRRFHSDMLMMGDVAKRTEKVYQMFNDCSTHDRFQAWDSNYSFNCEKGKFYYNDGSEGLVEKDTAMDPKAGISGTRQVVWLTEAARYKKTGGNDKKVITAVLNSLANVPKSLGIAESTPEGASGWFYDNWQGAVTLDQRKRGIVGNGWIKIFSPWYAFPEHCLERNETTEDYFGDELNERERRGIELFLWTKGQIAWRRMKIAKDCANDEKNFDQDFAEDPESCFLASGRNRFDVKGLTHLEKLAKAKHGLAKTGVLQATVKEPTRTEEVQFLPSFDGNTWFWCCEEPTPGLSYIAGLDPCTGEQGEGSAFPDAHAAGIVRIGYYDRQNIWHNPRLVAVIDVPNGCRWDDEVLAEKMRLMTLWYGDCMVVPETGNGLGALSQIKQKRIRVFQRRKENAMYPGQFLEVHGWETNMDTRPLVVNEIANRIREQAFDCEYLPAVQEMKTFVVNSRGRAEAKSGCHDDWVMFLGIVFNCLGFASVLAPPPSRFGPLTMQAIAGGDIGGGLPASAMS